MKHFFYLIFSFLLLNNCQKSFSQSVAAGEYNTLLICSSGNPKGAGNNWDGQLGTGITSSEALPVAANGLTGITGIAGGAYHTIAVKSDGTVWTYGYNGDGQLGDGTNNSSNIPVQVSGLTGIIKVAAGRYHSLALKNDGTVWGWGDNSYGQLGDGTYTSSNIPVQVNGLADVSAIGAGYYHSLAVKSTGTAWAWGDNSDGQLGDGTYNGSGIPVQVSSITDATAVAGGNYHSLVLKNDGTIWSFGYNGNGQLGDGTFTSSEFPVQVDGITNAISIGSGRYHSLAALSTGEAWVWGYNSYGQLGDGTYNDSEFPILVSGLTNVTSVAGGRYHSVAVQSDGTFWAWGYNGDGQLGDGTYNDNTSPVQMHDCCDNIPNIALSDTCIIDTLEIGGNNQNFFYIRNSACGTLNVTNISSDNAAFTVSPSSVSINNYDSVLITVTYTPTILGDNTGTLTILNNANDTTICLAGFCIQAPTIGVTPNFFNVTINSCNDSVTQVLTLNNTGPGTLNGAINTGVPSSGAIFYDGFESGNLSLWNIGTGTYIRTVVNTNPANGTYSAKLVGGSTGWLDGISHSFSSITPSYISFKIKSEAGNTGESNDVLVGRTSDISSNGPMNYFWVDNASSTVNMYTAWSGTLSTPMSHNQWHKIEFRNINFITHKFDYYVNGNLIMTNISFENAGINSLDVMHLFSYESNVANACYFDEIIVGTDPSKWLSETPVSVTVAPFGSTNLSVKFKSSNMVNGTYYGNVLVNSNDPANPQVAVLCTLTVNGTPKIALNKTCMNYGNVYVNGTKKDSVLLTNTGCDTLKANSIVSSSGVFTVNPAAGNIAPGQSAYVKVTFAPTAITSYSATLTFYSNVNDTSICLTGTGIAAPTVSVTPAALNVTLSSCNDSATYAVTVNNTGGSDLIFALPAAVNPTCSPTAGTQNTCCGMGIYNVTFNTINNTTSATDGRYKDYSATKNTVVQAGQTYTLSIQTSSGYSERDRVWIDYNNNGAFEGSELVLSDQQYQYHTATVTIPVTAVKNIALRMRVASDYYGSPVPGPCTNAVYGQTEDYTISIGNTVLASPSSGTVTPSGSTTVNVKFKSIGLGSGQYTSSLFINSNDPVNPQVAIPCTLTVNGAPKIVLNKTCLNYGSVIVGSSLKDSVLVTNTGCDTLKATSITASPGVYSVNPGSANIAPGKSAYVKVTFTPGVAASYSGAITFQSNVNDTTVCLTGAGIPPLSITVPIAGGSDHSLAICSLCSDAFAWGYNGNGQLGDGTLTTRYTRVLSKITNVSALAAGNNHSLALKNDGTVWAWGYNGYGQLGDNTYTQRTAPVKVTGLTGAMLAVAAGYYHSLALKSNGTVWAWGYNGNGQLGDGTTTQHILPAPVNSLTTAIAVASGYQHSMALKSDGTVWTWGYNAQGQLGDGTTVGKTSPVQVSGLTGVTAIAGGYYHSLALKSDGTVWAWGHNAYGQLGDVSNTQRLTPVQVSGLTGIVAVAAGVYHSVALKNDGTIWAWGYNGYGQLGNGSYSSSNVPVQVSGISTATAVATGYYHTLALKNDGTFWAWGNNGNGELGDGTTTNSTTPVQTKDICPPKQFDIHIPLANSCPKYDTLILGNSLSQSFKFYNKGCDTLRITGLTSSSGEFTVVSFPAKIAPVDSGTIVISLTPTATGTVTTTMSVFNNDADTTFCLQGVVIPRPIISTTTPTSFESTLACVDSTTSILTINNTGGSNLIYNISIQNPMMPLNAPVTATCSPTVGSKSNCCSMGIYNVTFNSINNSTLESNGRYLDYTSTQITTVVPGQTYTLSVQTAPVTYNEFTRAWIDFNNNGAFEGSELVLSDANFQYHTAAVTIPLSAVKNKAVRMRVASDYTGSAVPTPCSNADYGQTEDYTVKILDWLSLSSASGVIAPSGSNTVAVTLNSKGLSVGTYTANISISNNDPQNNPFNIPATLHVSGVGKITLSKNCMYMDSIMQFTSKIDSFYIKNTGCDVLNVTNITKNTPIFTVNTNTFTILTGDSAKVKVTYTPTSYPGLFLDTLKILNNDTIKKVCLSGKAFQRPIIATLPTALTTTLFCTDSSTSIVTINNNGGSNLTYNISLQSPVIPAFGSALPIAATCTPTTTGTCCNMGIYNVTFGSIYNTTANGTDGYKDYTATQNTTLIPGKTYTLSVSTGTSYEENVGAWIDYNNNGAFEAGEQVMTNLNTFPNLIHTTTVTIPNTSVKNKVLRMRIGSEYSPNPAPQPCTDVQYGQFEDYSVRILGWISLSASTGTVTPSSSNTVAVTFNSTNLSAGTYTATVSISNNDPQNNPTVVPCTLEVQGVGKIALAKNSMYMDSIMQFTSKVDSFYIRNSGCNTLNVTNITKSTPIFTVNTNTFSIPTGDSAKVKVTYTPTSYPGPFYDSLLILNSDVTKKVYLSGKAFQRPIIATVPTSLSYTLACCDSVTVPLQVNNTGGSTLTYTVTNVSSNGGSLKPKVLLLHCNGDPTAVQTALVSTGKFLNSDFTSMNNPANLTMTMLAPYDVVVVWSQNAFTNAAAKGDTLKKFVDNGGSVILATYALTNGWAIAGGILDPGYSPFTPTGGQCVSGNVNLATLPNPAHAIFKGITVNPTFSSNCNYSNPALTTGSTLLAKDASGNKVIAENASGKVLGMEIFPDALGTGNAAVKLLFANALYYAYNKVDWLTAAPLSNTVTASGSSTVNFEFKSCGKTVGTYSINVLIASNDPLHLTDTVPCTLKVTGEPDIVLTKTCMYLDSIIAFSTNRDSFYVKNRGCDTLKVTNIAKNTSLFTVNTTTVNILPGDSAKVRVTFAPVAVGTFLDTLKIFNNDDTLHKVCLSGKGFAQPVQCHAANSYTVHFTTCQDSILDTLTICNTGPGDLNYNLWSPFGKVVSVDGSGDYVSTPLTIDQSATSPGLTLEAWVYPTSTSGGYHHVISTDDGGYDWSILRVNGTWYVFTGENVRSTGFSADANVWQHIAAVFIPGYGINFYKNGVLATIPFIDYDASSHTLSVGGSPAFGEYFDGKIDEARVFNKKLNQSEILASITKTLNGNESGLKGYWNFDSGTANDGSVNGNNGTLNGDAAITTTANVTFLPASTGTVTPAGTYSVQVKFKKAGLAVGTQTVTVYLNSNDPLNPSDTIIASVTVDAVPPSPTATSNSPVCEGTNLSLTSSTVSGATYSWTGPDGFTSTLQYPVITGVSTAGSGTYSVVAIIPGCPQGAAGTTTVVVNPAPSVPTAGSNGTVCTGRTLSLTASTISGATYAWTGPGGFISSTQNPLIAGITTSYAGTYSVTATVSGCPPTTAGTTTVTINVTPSVPSANSNTPVCSGNDLSLNASTISGVTYAWTGPNTFTSSSQYPVISSITTAGSGNYSVTATENGCPSSAGTTSVTINPPPAVPTAGSNGTVCSGKTISLTSSTISGASYSWTGPNGFTSTVQHPTISNVPSAAAGTYSVTATVTGCPTTAAGTTSVVINPTPVAPTATNSSPLCVGADLTLTAGTVGSSTYAWSGPASFSSASQIATIASVTTAKAGTYSVTATENGCTSTAGTTTVVVNSPPAAPTATSNSPACVGLNISLNASTIASATYAWSGPNSFTSSSQNPSITGVATADAGTYSVIATLSGCIGTAGTVTVIVNTPPAVPTASGSGTLCSGQTLTLAASSTGTSYSWTGPNNFTSTLQNPNISTVTTAGSGTYSVSAIVGGCPPSAKGTTTVTINQTPGAPTASSNAPICAGTDLSLTAGNISGASYAWAGPGSFTNSVQNPVISSATTSASGTYSVAATVSGCTGPAGTTSVTVNPAPPVPTATNNSTICAGTTLSLSASSISGAVYSWTGPNSFTSTAQNPTITNVTTAANGTYSVTATVPGCPTTSAGTTSVTINPTPAAPTANSNSPVCVGSDLSLSAGNISGATYAWTGPNSFTDATQNPVVTSAITAMSGTYSVTATVGGCTGPKGTTTVTVNPPPSVPTPNGNTPICSGQTLSLTSNLISGATYSWTGPDSFTASAQNPTIVAIPSTGSGTYSVTATVPGCPASSAGTTTIVVNQSPDAPTANGNSPICSGQTLTLTAGTVGSATYAWTGPATFTSTSQIATIAGITTAKSGTYSVTATENGCTSPAGTTSVTVNQTPVAPTANSNSPVCSGQTLSLTASNITSATYIWSGPNSFSNTSQNPTIGNASTTEAGTYLVTATVNGCTGSAGTTTVSVNPSIASPVASSNSTVCSGQTLNLFASVVSGATYLWTGPNSFSSTAQNPTIASVTTSKAGTYSVSASVSGCGSAASTTTVVINQTPAAPSATNNSPVCVGTSITLSAGLISGASYAWTGPNSFTDASQNPVIGSAATSHGGTYSVTATVDGCTGSAGTTTVTINVPPTVPVATNNSTICSGQNLILTSSTVSGAIYSWTGPNSFTSTTQNPNISAVTTAANGTYSVTATTTGCPASAPGTTSVTVNQTPAAPVASANSSICVGFTLSLNASAAGTTYFWNGPSAYTSAIQNPVIASVTSANTGTYSVTATTLGCTGPAGTVSVVVNSIPSAPAAANQNACFGATIPDLTATGSNIQWYNDLGAFAFSGNPYATGQTVAGTYTYTATQTVNGCTSPSRTVTLTINTLPATPNAGSDISICYGNPTPDLTSTGTNINWYDGTGALVGTGSPYATGLVAPGSYTFVATQTNATTSCESLGDDVILTINAIAPPTAPDVAICAGNPVPPLVATGTNIQWYNVNQTLVFSGNTFNTGQTAVGTYTYYVSQTNTVTTCSSLKDTVLLTISTQPTLAPTVADASVCFGSAIPDLTATSGTIISWYSDAALTNEVHNGTIFATGLTTVGSYTFFATDSTPGCGEGPSDPVVLTINALPAAPAVNDTSACFGNSVPDLIASGTNIQWYNSSLAVVSVNDTFATGQTAANTYTYYVTQTNTTTGCESAMDTVQLTIHASPAKPSALDTAVCSSATIPDLSSSGINVQWYDTLGAFVFTGNSFTTGHSTQGVYPYLVTQKDAVTGCESIRDTSVLIILLSPPVPVANNVAVCSGNPIPALTSTGLNPHWYSNAALTNLVHSGNSYNTGNTAVGVYTYYVTDSLTGCVSISADSVTLTINSSPAKPTANDLTVCYGSPSVLTTTGTNPQWFSDTSLITNVGTGNSFNTGLTGVGTYTYYVTDYAAGCGNSVSDTAVLTINPIPLVTANTHSVTILQGGNTALTAHNAVSYTWAPPAGLNTSTGQTVAATPTVTTTYTVTGTNSYGCSSNVTILVVVNPLGVAALADPVQDVNVYPNPAIDAFTLEFNTTLETPIAIYMVNTLGDKVRVLQADASQGSGLMKHKYKIDTNTLTEGIYNLEIVTEKGTVNRRVVLFR